jgi:hypothetical protein
MMMQIIISTFTTCQAARQAAKNNGLFSTATPPPIKNKAGAFSVHTV